MGTTIIELINNMKRIFVDRFYLCPIFPSNSIRTILPETYDGMIGLRQELAGWFTIILIYLPWNMHSKYMI